ncbi:MAG: cytochrome d ubiquinol oxidase subunit II [Leptospirillum sp.]
MFDYGTLKELWWGLVVVLLSGFFITDGFDMGVGFLLPWIGKSDIERRVLINSVGPHWEGNQVWFITAGGALFAAWPIVYATAFSGFYVAMILVLWALFFRPVGFDYRSKIENPSWRTFWDGGLFIGGTVPAMVFGVAFGNLFIGVPFRLDNSMRSFYEGTFWGLLNPFGIASGALSLSMIALHGGAYLLVRTESVLQKRAAKVVTCLSLLTGLLYAAIGVWVTRIPGYRIISGPGPEDMPNPLAKTVVREQGAWLNNFHAHPNLWGIVITVFLGTFLAFLGGWLKSGRLAFTGSTLAGVGVILTASVSLFPFILPSSLDPGASLTAWDAVSSRLTLQIMFWATLILTPITIIYTSWAYWVLRGPVTIESVSREEHTLY